ncbi:CLUMA_CG014754, isoform A [Clunio marinus]|uniref:CLUMA_CG014754, isoform A n=1 Tax=Clunio marinus TaxID=568069 RepID=A0A1J1INN6_9DIPT|nr:CLUMA_CG014754, isoform A [Clunio marinus]
MVMEKKEKEEEELFCTFHPKIKRKAKKFHQFIGWLAINEFKMGKRYGKRGCKLCETFRLGIIRGKTSFEEELLILILALARRFQLKEK